MFFQGYHVFSSLVGSRNIHDEMLEFSGRHGVKPMVQIFKHEGASTIKEVFELVEQNKMRYRAVLEMPN
jgi:D-arabinose 1-dehydrogenase-like Zn-dependent alcohol dehydrogenase